MNDLFARGLLGSISLPALLKSMAQVSAEFLPIVRAFLPVISPLTKKALPFTLSVLIPTFQLCDTVNSDPTAWSILNLNCSIDIPIPTPEADISPKL